MKVGLGQEKLLVEQLMSQLAIFHQLARFDIFMVYCAMSVASVYCEFIKKLTFFSQGIFVVLANISVLEGTFCEVRVLQLNILSIFWFEN